MQRILITRTDRIGDVVLSTPVIYNLRQAFPKAHIAFICRPYTRQILEGNPYLDEVIIYDKYGKERSFLNSWRFARKIAKKKFGLALILHPTNRMHLVTFLAGIPKRVGWDRKLGFLLTKRLKHTKQEGKKHESEYTLDVLTALNIKISSKETYFPIKPEAMARVEQALGGDDKIILVHPSASCPSKRWPQENFSELVKILKQRSKLGIAVITSADQKKFGQKIIDENQILDLRGVFDLAEVGALLKRCALFISNDSGPVHIAAALGVPVISIFGRKDPGLSPLRWMPLGKDAYFFHKDAGCQKCLAHDCLNGFLCLKSITPQEVTTQALKIIGDGSRAH